MSVDQLARKLEQADKAGRPPKVVIPVHLAGQSCEMEAIAELASRYGFRVIEDASHAVGADYQGRPVGDCRFSDIAVFSFHPVKIITTGEGGLALTKDPALAERMGLYRSHGVTRDAAAFEHQPNGGWYYEQQALGFNYRMTDIAAALGASQLTRLDEFIARRRGLAARYDEMFGNAPLVRPWQHPDSQSSWHLYVVRVEPGCHMAAFDALREGGIGVNLHYMPVYLQPFYRRLGFEPGLCPDAEAYYAEAITLPLYPALGDEEQDEVVAAVKAVLGCA
jgi:dTDP-4-amino-4,6-dideoxygalactose transaminase